MNHEGSMVERSPRPHHLPSGSNPKSMVEHLQLPSLTPEAHR